MRYTRAVEHPRSTLEGVTSTRKARLAAWIRRGFLVLVLLFVVAALLGYLGVKDSTASASGGGYRLSLTYARIARPGLDVPWTLRITHPGGFSGPVRVELSSAYLGILEQQGMTPQSASETQDGSWWHLTFARPQGDTLVIDLDVYIKPSSHRGRSGVVRVMDGGAPAASLGFSTALLP
jgi:hypothetical protein